MMVLMLESWILLLFGFVVASAAVVRWWWWWWWRSCGIYLRSYRREMSTPFSLL